MTYLPLPTSHGDIHESAGVCDSLLCASLGGLLLLLWFHLLSQRYQHVVPSSIISAMIWIYISRRLQAGLRVTKMALAKGAVTLHMKVGWVSYLGGLRFDFTSSG